MISWYSPPIRQSLATAYARQRASWASRLMPTLERGMFEMRAYRRATGAVLMGHLHVAVRFAHLPATLLVRSTQKRSVTPLVRSCRPCPHPTLRSLLVVTATRRFGGLLDGTLRFGWGG